jgi:hypothetical protein
MKLKVVFSSISKSDIDKFHINYPGVRNIQVSKDEVSFQYFETYGGEQSIKLKELPNGHVGYYQNGWAIRDNDFKFNTPEEDKKWRKLMELVRAVHKSTSK